jgi:hypothetical protein
VTKAAVPAGWLEVVCAATPAATVAALYHQAAGLWWLGDDPVLVAFAKRWRPRDYFLDPEVVAELPWRLLAPLQILAYDVDLALWGELPAASHTAHLVVMAAASSVIYAVLRLWLERWAALASVMVFVMGAPVAAAAPQLMVRHYVIGLALAFVAAALWTLAVRHRRMVLAVLAAGPYLAAAAAKEVFVPLPLLVLLLPEGRQGDRLRYGAPLGAALALYLGWRWWMLRTLAGGYGFVAEPEDWPRLVPDLFTGATRGLFGGGPAGWVLAAAAAVALAALARRRPAAAMSIVAAGLLVLAPVLPVARAMAPRYLLVPWLWVAVVLVLGCREWQRGGSGSSRRVALGVGRPFAGALVGVAVLVVGAATAALTGGRAWGDVVTQLENEGAAGRFVYDRGAPHMLRRPDAPSHYLEAVSTLAARDGSGGARWFEDDLFLCLHPGLMARVWQRTPSSTAFTEITSRLTALRREYCASLRDTAPLAVRFEWAGGRLSWRLGPHAGDGWAFVLADGQVRIEVPQHGNLLHGARRGLSLRVRYEDDAGWVTYSPELQLDLTTEGTLEWER